MKYLFNANNNAKNHRVIIILEQKKPLLKVN